MKYFLLSLLVVGAVALGQLGNGRRELEARVVELEGRLVAAEGRVAKHQAALELLGVMNDSLKAERLAEREALLYLAHVLAEKGILWQPGRR